nr:hypothetical protein [Tanacetum cinerariifolium]
KNLNPRIEGWHERFFYVRDPIISAKYPQLLSEQNKLYLKSFKDKLPPNIEENAMFQRLSRYPISVHVFPDPILFLAGLKPSWEHGQQRPTIMASRKEMDFKNYIFTKDDDDLAFLPKEPSSGFSIGSLSASVNIELPKDVKEPEVQPVEVTTNSGESLNAGVFIVHPGSIAAKLASSSSSSHAVRAKTSASKDDSPFLSIYDDDEGFPGCFKLKDANAYHLKISAITLLAWKDHLDNQMDLELLDLHDRCYAWERSREEECEGLRVKCEDDMAEFDQNLVRGVTFPDPILFLAGLKPSWEHGQQRPMIMASRKEMDFKNYIFTKDDDDLAFLPKEPSSGFSIGSLSASVNIELPKDVKEPEVQPVEVTTNSGESLNAGVFIVHPGSIAARIKERKYKTKGGSSRPPVKRKLASSSSSSHAVRAKTSASKDDSPFLSIYDDDEGFPGCFKLKDANAYHLKISAITLLAWKDHLDNQMDLELLDLHDRCYAW